MTGDADSEPQIWLMTGPTPSGPFTAADIRARMADGSLPPGTPACPVGGTEWKPLAELPGLGPDPVAPPPVPVCPPAAPGSTGDDRWAAVGGFGGLAIGVLVLAAVGYGVYEWVRPLTAMEVCDRFLDGDTPSDIAPYVTARFRAAVADAFDGTPVSAPDDEFDLAGEAAGPDADTRHVGFRTDVFVPEAGRRVRPAGYLRVVRADGWKVDDMVVTRVDGTPVDAPMSLVAEHARAGAKPPNPPAPPARGLVAWYNGLDQRHKRYFGMAVILAVGGLIRRAWASMTSARRPAAETGDSSAS